ncbi:uncharacterized protein LOC115876014 isoform X1 [Sitophilus oryzae]|uniref:Uncharacterized protein LOC115876014 isoform X1 n=1 Tax=Sitophilus oryzae TaxID=7048 RepID=A0A6J2X8J7_SITOR|nr:uncharacterized protein LOC115876014 isoform X1 [Sitophilus oryzae]
MSKRSRSGSLDDTDSEAKKIKTNTKYVEENLKRSFKEEKEKSSGNESKIDENNIKETFKNVELLTPQTTINGNGNRNKSVGEEASKSQKRKKSLIDGRELLKKENDSKEEITEKENTEVENNIRETFKNIEKQDTENGNGSRRGSLGGDKTQKRKKSLTDGKLKRKLSGSGPSRKRICVTRNQCVCGPNGAEPAKSQLVEDHEAHMLVAEWRLHKFQSPIELSHEESITHDHFDPLEFHGHWDNDGVATFTNTGKTVVLRFSERATPYLVGGPLHKDTYCFEQLHFHWSDDDSGGCEHIFEGRAYSMEAHAVHYNLKYGSFKDAVDKPDGLAVIGFFLEATDNEDNPCFSEMVKGVQNVIKINTTTNIAPDCLNWIKEEAQCKGYYTYQGSLTTEPYLESVTWILYPTPIHVSRQQVAYFRELKSTACEKINIVNNVRPIQSPPADKKINVIFARSHKQSE